MPKNTYYVMQTIVFITEIIKVQPEQINVVVSVLKHKLGWSCVLHSLLFTNYNVQWWEVVNYIVVNYAVKLL